MDALLDLLVRTGPPAGLAPLVVAAAVKGSLLLAAAALLARALRGASAAARHLVWSVAIVSQLLVAPLSLVLPRWDAPVLPARSPAAASWGNVAVSAPAVPDEGAPGGARPAANSGEASVAGRSHDLRPRDQGAVAERGWNTLAATIWLVGVLMVLLRLAVGTLQLTRLARRASRVTDPHWLSLAQRVAVQFGLGRPLTILRGTRLSVPVTWGILYPVVLLPAEADLWDEERRRVVLMHEVAHVKRLDALTQLVSQIALAAFWFNPFLWATIRRARSERERACDDWVLSAGTRPSEYVHHLVDIVRSVGPATGPAFAALAMARRSEFEGRMLAVLDAGSPRRGPGRAATAAAAAAALLTAPVAALRAVPPTEGPPLSGAAAAATVPAIRSVFRWSAGSGGVDRSPPEFRWAGLLPPGQSIEVKGTSGDVSAIPAAGDSVEVLVQVRSPEGRPPEVEVEVVQGPTGVTVCAVYPSPDPRRPNTCAPGEGTQSNREGRLDDVHFTVRVPRGVGFIGRSVSGDVSATSLTGDVSGHTVSGDVSVSTSGFARASTVSGDVRAEIGRTDWADTLALRSASGDVLVTLPPGASTAVLAAVRSGSIASEFPLALQALGERGQRASGTVGAGGRVLHLETTSGRIRLGRGSAAAARRPLP